MLGAIFLKTEFQESCCNAIYSNLYEIDPIRNFIVVMFFMHYDYNSVLKKIG